MNKALLLWTFLLGYTCSFAQTLPARVSGLAPEYAGQKISLQADKEPITGQPETIGTITVLPDGSFSTAIKLQQTLHCFATFDRWQAEIYLEPGHRYEIVLPPYQPLSEAEKQNPFFQPQLVSFGIKNPEKQDINQLIREFESTYNQLENKYFSQIFKDKSRAAADSLINQLAASFPKTDHPYFEEYKNARYASVQFTVNQNRTNNFIPKYLDHPPFNFNLPPFRQLFEQLFSNYFNNESNRIEGVQFTKLAGTANLTGLENYFRNNKGWSEQLTRIVILKGINDAFYLHTYSPGIMLNLLDQVQQSDWPDEDKERAKSLSQKLRYLLPGTDAPNISMTNFDGKKQDLNRLEGSLIYLHFTTVTNPICRRQLDELAKIAAQFKGQFKIINLLPEANSKKKELIMQQNWAGTFYTVTDDQREKYKVKTFPTSYLIDENGKLISSPALNALDGLDRQLAGYFKEKQLERFQNQAK
jgi:peroxiredoxin